MFWRVFVSSNQRSNEQTMMCLYTRITVSQRNSFCIESEHLQARAFYNAIFHVAVHPCYFTAHQRFTAFRYPVNRF